MVNTSRDSLAALRAIKFPKEIIYSSVQIYQHMHFVRYLKWKYHAEFPTVIPIQFTELYTFSLKLVLRNTLYPFKLQKSSCGTENYSWMFKFWTKISNTLSIFVVHFVKRNYLKLISRGILSRDLKIGRWEIGQGLYCWTIVTSVESFCCLINKR